MSSLVFLLFTSQQRTIPFESLQNIFVVSGLLSWPAISQNWRRYTTSSIFIIFDENWDAIVAWYTSSNLFNIRILHLLNLGYISIYERSFTSTTVTYNYKL